MGFGDNFHMDEDKAYTEDNVLVYNLFVCNLPRKILRHQIREYFNEFGKVSSTRILFQRNFKRCKQAFVNFKDPRDAAKVLQSCDHSIKSRRLRILACDSWHQPDGQQTVINCCTYPNFSLLRLNDYCLEMIFGFLQISDQVNLTRCDCRLKDIFGMYARIKYKMLQLEIVQLLTIWQTRLFFEMAGPYIEQIVGRVPSRLVLKFVGNYCRNVKSIKFHNDARLDCKWQVTLEDLSKLLKKSYLITELELNNVYLKDNCILLIQKLQNLKILSLAMNYDLTGRNIRVVTRLEKLSINNCRGIQPTFFKEMCEHLTELTALEMQNCSLLKTADLREMVQHLRRLETLKISCDNVEIECVALLPNLKNLHLHAEGYLSPAIFAALATHLGEQLQLLEVRASNSLNLENVSSISKFRKLKVLICPRCRGLDDTCLEKLSELRTLEVLNLKHCNRFTDGGLLNLVGKCPNLNTLNVTGCSQLSNEFAKSILHLLISERKLNQFSRQLKIKASFSRISDFALSTSRLEPDADLPILLLEFSWD